MSQAQSAGAESAASATPSAHEPMGGVGGEGPVCPPGADIPQVQATPIPTQAPDALEGARSEEPPEAFGPTESPAMLLLALLNRFFTAEVRSDHPELTTRQLAILLQIYFAEKPATVRALARSLDLGKPAVTRALDTLSRHGFVRRVKDADDKRNVLLYRTVRGSVFLRELGDGLLQAGASSQQEPGR